MIRKAELKDAPRVTEIYNHYVATTCYTFDVEPRPVSKFEEMISSGHPWLVFENEGVVAGFAYSNKWKEKYAYRFTHESTIYLEESCPGRGIGSQLYKKLFEVAKEQGLRSLVACIVLPHDQSVHFHEKLGFVKTAHFKEVGYKFDKWLDVGYWQLQL